MEALADKVHRQGEHVPQHCYISRNHPYKWQPIILVSALFKLIYSKLS